MRDYFFIFNIVDNLRARQLLQFILHALLLVSCPFTHLFQYAQAQENVSTSDGTEVEQPPQKSSPIDILEEKIATVEESRQESESDNTSGPNKAKQDSEKEKSSKNSTAKIEQTEEGKSDSEPQSRDDMEGARSLEVEDKQERRSKKRKKQRSKMAKNKDIPQLETTSKVNEDQGGLQPLLPKPILRIAFIRDSRRFGLMNQTFGITTPGGFYFYGGTNLRSRDDSHGEIDLSIFSSGINVFSPHYKGFGVIGNYSTFSESGNTTGRVGLYYRLLTKISGTSYFIVPAIYPFNEGSNQGRFMLFWGLSWFDGFVKFRGDLGYVLVGGENIQFVKAIITFRLIDGMRLYASYDNVSSRTSGRDGIGIGIEFNELF